MGLAMLPAILRKGNSLVYGLFKAVFNDNGILELCDPYGCAKYKLSVDTVSLHPTYPVNRPSQLANCVYIELEEQLVVDGERDFWVKAPFDIVVLSGGVELGVFTPTKVKYTLVGDVSKGDICRYYRSSAFEEFEACTPDFGEALVYVKVKGAGIVKATGFYARSVSIYVDEHGRVYYDKLYAKLAHSIVEFEPAGAPPIPGLTGITYTAYSAKLLPLLSRVFSIPAT